jgi:hypothetical protein
MSDTFLNTQLQSVVRRGLEYFSSRQFYVEFLSAKTQFFQFSDVLREGDPQFAIRNQQFLDWYFFSRKLDSINLPPAHALTMFPDLVWSESELVLIEALKRTVHSLFQVEKVKPEWVRLRDLRSKKSYDISLTGSYFFLKDQILDARVLDYSGNIYLFEGRCFHPPEASSFLEEFMKKARKDPDWDFESFSYLTIKMRYLYERYPNARIEQIYSLKNRWFEYDPLAQRL